jgi:hypothetical protein
MKNHIGLRRGGTLAAFVCGALGFALGILSLFPTPARAQPKLDYGPFGFLGYTAHDPIILEAEGLLASYNCIPADRQDDFLWTIYHLTQRAEGLEGEAETRTILPKLETDNADRRAADDPNNEDEDIQEHVKRARDLARARADLANESRLNARKLRILIARLKSIPLCPPPPLSATGIAGGTALHIAAPAPVSGTAGSPAAPEVMETFPLSYTFGRSQSYFDFSATAIMLRRVTITSPTDKDTFKYNSPTFQIGGQFNSGRWFANAQVAVPVFPRGTLNESFGGSGSSTFDINTGLIGIVQASAGYAVYQTPSMQIGLFGQFYASSESLSVALPGSRMEVSLLSDRWLAGGGGVKLDRRVWLGGVPATFSASVAGLFDSVQSGLFHGGGGGVQATAGFSLPVGPGQFGVSAQYTDLTASGSSLGVPLRQTEQDLLLSVSYTVHTVQRGIIP